MARLLLVLFSVLAALMLIICGLNSSRFFRTKLLDQNPVPHLSRDCIFMLIRVTGPHNIEVIYYRHRFFPFPDHRVSRLSRSRHFYELQLWSAYDTIHRPPRS
jgi:hypothetical protein